MKAIIELYNSYLVKFPKLKQEKFVTILAEGLEIMKENQIVWR
ncbi:hypothetical protein [Vallitalea maricola]|uniref:Uncharacterized protein n=1 Tax=Vallitalea maricola TaxID=3074433 RepID=A0ACB5UP55_9FIRM|nr:hypothetical protein AN2V17_35620 [Vallitalea sp. AN17-2]